jgi:hypothetical protein
MLSVGVLVYRIRVYRFRRSLNNSLSNQTSFQLSQTADASDSTERLVYCANVNSRLKIKILIDVSKIPDYHY